MDTIESKVVSPVYAIIAETLLQAGVECVFGVLGEDTAPLGVAITERGIKYYAARHENQAVAMADGYARTTGKLGVATVTGGPGFTNALTAINTAHRARTPLLLLTGAGRAQEDDHNLDVVRQANGAAWLKHFPQAAVLEQIGIPCVKPLEPAEAPADAVRALELARRGTVALVLGRGLLLTKIEADLNAAPAVKTAAPPAELPHEAISELADLLQESWAVSAPVILAGHGAVVSGAGPALQKLASITGALLATSLRARGLFHADPYSVGVCGSYATPVAVDLITQANCILAFGATLNPWTTYNNSLFPKALLVQVDENPTAIGRFLDTAIGIQGDAKAIAEALVAELERRGHSAQGYRNPQVRQQIADYNKAADVKDRSTATLIDPRTLMLELDKLLPPERILCADAGQQSRFAGRYIETQSPRNFMQTTDGGALGLGIGIATGVAIGRPGELVVSSVGDGGLMMALGDLESMIRWQLPVLVIITNDERFGAEVNVLANLGMDTAIVDTPSPSFEKVAQAMGAQAATVRSVKDLAVINTWLKEKPTVPLVLDCRVNPDVRAE